LNLLVIRFSRLFCLSLQEFINHFYKNVLKLIDRAMRKEDNSPQATMRTHNPLYLFFENGGFSH
jgi:hypothetical protein